MYQPEGFNDNTARVCKLLKSLYGLKQASRCWIQHFTSFLKSFGFSRSTADPCFYIFKNELGKILLAFYVDDGLLAATNELLIEEFFLELEKQFKITETKNVTSFLGVEILKLPDGSIFINQGKFIGKILERFNMNNANVVSTPIDTGWDLSGPCKIEKEIPYREAVGNLLYVQVISRPDISFAVNIASRALENPSVAHWSLVKRIMRYLKGTADLGLLYCKNGDFEAYSDADFAGDRETRKSTSGILCKNANAAIVWQSKRQQCVSLSTTESEYVSAASAIKEIIWLKGLLAECGNCNGNFCLHVDNMSAIRLIKNPEFHQRSKHIDVKFHFIRDMYEKGVINIKHVSSDEQIADIFTKALAKSRFNNLRCKLGLVSKENVKKSFS